MNSTQHSILGCVESLLLSCALLAAPIVARAETPDPTMCVITPADNLNGPFVCPSAPEPVPASVLNILALTPGGVPIAGAAVAVVFTSAFHACADAVLTGVTDGDGRVSIVVSGSECAEGVSGSCAIKINGVTIRDYRNIKSPDGDVNGVVDLSDLIRFASEFNGVEPARCHDYNNDHAVNLIDLSLFAASFGRASHCP